ncbi:hypothetical protein AYO21_11332 [Fonsecaea monophora]|uniref:Xylanolytic transcriptional activator regulatory domain-containing protein n=1 Tax=Fonsecaea monophora TaxID=254056 RepID=A0A177ET77_9EURO|nr:hypothetical protein AYO21_11332 [Fonsecaea monophora]KAH0831532.1 putative acetamidase regulatory protein [Fonsecaea pedrosoi]OAG34510.1 hypothetical protein AYO21_11332 [Fonsecaea monophora]
MLDMTQHRDRARIVCKACHARKVKCNLEDSLNGACYNCIRRKLSTALNDPSSQEDQSPNTAHLPSPKGQHDNGTVPPVHAPAASVISETGDRSGYVGDESALACGPDSTSEIQALETDTPCGLDEISQNMLRVSGALSLPGHVMTQAMIDLYYTHAFHRMPVIDKADLLPDGTSALLTHAICMLGLLLRHPQNTSNRILAYPHYRNAKILITLNYEQDNRTALKAMCLLTAWSMQPPSGVSLDSPWHWNGVSLRLSLQMGLHRESTYRGRADTRITRRIWWTVYAILVLQAACFGRPLGITLDGFDVNLPRPEDFEEPNDQALVFIEHCKLIVIMAQILEANVKRRRQHSFDVTYIMVALQDWIRQVPAQLQLYEGNRRKPYYRLACELNVIYCVCVILFFRMCANAYHQPIADQCSLIAASRIARLYEEMAFRDDINFLLPINNYFAMVAGAQLIARLKSLPTPSETLNEEVKIIRVNMLENMSIKWPAAGAVLTRLRYLEQASVRSTNHGTSGPNFDEGGTAAPLSNEQSDNVLASLFPFPNTTSSESEPSQTYDRTPTITATADSLPMNHTNSNAMQWILGDDYLDLGMFDIVFEESQTWADFHTLAAF